MKPIAFLLLSFIFLANVAFADFTLNNPTVDFGSKNSGESLSNTLNVTNGAADTILIFPGNIGFTGPANYTVDISITGDPVLLADEQRAFDYSLTLPSDMIAGDYAGTISIIDDQSDAEEQSLSLSVAASASFDLREESVDYGRVFYNETKSVTFTLRNTGNTPLSGITLSSSADSSFEMQFSEITSLAPGEEKEITATIFVPFDTTIEDRVNLGSLVIGSDQLSDATFNSFFLLDVGSYLSLEKVRTKVETTTQTISEDGDIIDEKARPLEKVELDVEVENLWKSERNEEIEFDDVEVELKVFAIDKDDEDIEFTSETVSLDFEGNERKHTFHFEFLVPVETDDGTYDMEIKLTGTDDEDNDYEVIWNIDLEVDRDSHDLIISEYSLSPSQVSCEGSSLADIEISNLGKNDEDYVRFTLKNSELGIDEVKSRFEIEADIEEDEIRHRETVPLSISNPSDGTYPVELRVYRDFDTLEDILTRNLVISGCDDQDQASNEVEEPQGEPEPVPVIAPPEPQVPAVSEPDATQEPEEEETDVEVDQTETVEQPRRVQQTPQVRVADNQPVLVGTPAVNAYASFRESPAYVYLLGVGYLFVLFLALFLIVLVRK